MQVSSSQDAYLPTRLRGLCRSLLATRPLQLEPFLVAVPTLVVFVALASVVLQWHPEHSCCSCLPQGSSLACSSLILGVSVSHGSCLITYLNPMQTSTTGLLFPTPHYHPCEPLVCCLSKELVQGFADQGEVFF